MLTNVLDLIGRIFISAIFLLSGINKIGNYEGSHGWMESLGSSRNFVNPSYSSRSSCTYSYYCWLSG